MRKSKLERQYEAIRSHPSLGKQYCVIVVYTSPEPDGHAALYTFPEELNSVVEQFRKVVRYVYSIKESEFLERVEKLKGKHEHVLVYNMVYGPKSVGSRDMIFALCEWYDLIPLNKRSSIERYESDLFDAVKFDSQLTFPETYYITCAEDITQFLQLTGKTDKWVLKPHDKFASIGVEVVDSTSVDPEFIQQYQDAHPGTFCIQEFITGDEVSVPLIKIGEDFCCPGISQVIRDDNRDYIDVVATELCLYRYNPYTGPDDNLIGQAIRLAQILEVEGVSRVDFRIRDGIAYVISLIPNPAIHHGIEELFEDRCQDKGALYRLLVHQAI